MQREGSEWVAERTATSGSGVSEACVEVSLGPTEVHAMPQTSKFRDQQ